ncbi:TfuA-like protein [Streptomyces sp. NPDC099088]|uniref:TfuA-like protein n=1 Tax=Streptomyces sp. NPDC099088 TaxID=3366101 RepID=UPI00380591E2
MNRIYVFVGPSAGGAAGLKQEIIDRCTVLPPVQAGDLLKLNAVSGDVVILIDGYFYNRPAVRHKEILYLLSQGVQVHGAASMGALRAAELAPFGMVGHGAVFAAYQSGDLVGDDEVAVVHGGAEHGYRPLTDALVSLRYKMHCAINSGACTSEVARKVIEAAKKLHFPQRNWLQIAANVRQVGVPEADLEVVRDYLRQRSVDIKQIDASCLLEKVVSGSLVASPPVSRWEFAETLTFHKWRSPEPAWFRLCRLFAMDYPEFHEAAAIVDIARKVEPGSLDSIDVAREVARRAILDRSLVDVAASHRFYTYWLTSRERDLPTGMRLTKVAARALYSEQIRLARDPMLVQASDTSAHREAKRYIDLIENFRQQHDSFPDEIDPARIVEWFQRRWDVTARDFPSMVRARGFSSVISFVQAARPFYLFDRHLQNIELRMNP